MRNRAVWVALAAAIFSSCGTRSALLPEEKLTVAAAANLTEVFAQMGSAFTAKTGVAVVFSYGSTAQLAQQIENGAPFDVFAAADTEHVDTLVATHKLVPESRATYALGQLALWIPRSEQTGVRELKDLSGPQVRFLAVAKPELAPYGQATVEALKKAGLWQTLEPKVVYASSISQAKQLAASGNADAVFTAYSLVLHEQGTVLKIDRRLYAPIEQALAIVSASLRAPDAAQFRSFVLGAEGQSILVKNGYLHP